MESYDLVIRGGTVVTAADIVEKCDVGIADGRIVSLGAKLGRGREEIDAAGKLVLPGGVDSHCHIDQPPSVNGGQAADTFESATRSAAAGGTTTVVCFSNQAPGKGVAESLAEYHERAKSSHVDYAFHLTVTNTEQKTLDDLPALVRQGNRSIKVFMTYNNNKLNDDQLLQILAIARKNRALVTVHAENHAAIMFLTKALLDAGLIQTKYHAWAKPMLVEREAVHRIIALAELLDQPIQIFHVSGAEAAEEVRRAQHRGLKVFAESCSQYFVHTAADLDRPKFEGAKYLFSPAPRTEADHAALWEYVRTGVLGVVSSDHVAYNFEGKGGKKIRGENASFDVIPNGIPGLETRLPVLFSEGVVKGRIDLQTFVAITATNPAKLFGLAPKKGTIAVGSDADVVIWDPERKTNITNEILHHGADYTTFEGMEVTGWPAMTIAHGKVICDDGKILGKAGHGKYLARAPYDYINPRNKFVIPFNPVEGRLV